jgi:hypothetical protein
VLTDIEIFDETMFNKCFSWRRMGNVNILDDIFLGATRRGMCVLTWGWFLPCCVCDNA